MCLVYFLYADPKAPVLRTTHHLTAFLQLWLIKVHYFASGCWKEYVNRESRVCGSFPHLQSCCGSTVTQCVGLPPVTLASCVGTSLSPGCSASHWAPCWCTREGSRGWLKCLGPWHPCGRLGWSYGSCLWPGSSLVIGGHLDATGGQRLEDLFLLSPSL